MGKEKGMFIQVELSGSGYYPELEDEIAALMPEGVSFMVHGERAPAAGPDLLINVALEYAAPAVCGWAIGIILDRLMDCVKARLGHEPELGSVVVSYPQYELRVLNKSFLDEEQACLNRSDMNQIIEKVARMAEHEFAQGRIVSKVTVPCKVGTGAGLATLCSVGVGDLDTWLVEYSNVSLVHAYDSTGGSFIKVDGITYPYGA